MHSIGLGEHTKKDPLVHVLQKTEDPKFVPGTWAEVNKNDPNDDWFHYLPSNFIIHVENILIMLWLEN